MNNKHNYIFLIFALIVVCAGFGFLTDFDYGFSDGDLLTGAAVGLQEEGELLATEGDLQIMNGNGSQCGPSVTTDITLVQDVNSSTSCFIISAPGVTIDCAGYTIGYGTVGPAMGVDSNNHGNAIVKNCNFVNNNVMAVGNADINFFNVLDGQIVNNTFNGLTGVQSSGCNRLTIVNNTFITNVLGPQGRAISYANSDNGLIQGNRINVSGDSTVGFLSSGRNVNNTINNNVINVDCNSLVLDSYGMRIEFMFNTTISNNNITGNNLRDTGIIFMSSSSATVTGNKIITLGGQGEGIELLQGTNTSSFSSNNLSTKGHGFSVSDGSNENNFTNNVIATSTDPGQSAPFAFYVEDALSTQIIGNRIINKEEDGGIALASAASYTNVSHNTVLLLDGDGIVVATNPTPSGFIDITNNTVNSSAGGITVAGLNDSTITNNHINLSGGTSGIGINLGTSSRNIISGNVMNTFDGIAISLDAATVIHYNNSISTTNTEFGEPIYYYAYNSSITIEHLDNVGQLILANCTNMMINNVTIDKDGLHFYETTYSSLQNSTLSADGIGERPLAFISACNYNSVYHTTINTVHPNNFDIFVLQSSNNLINTTFNPTKVYVSASDPASGPTNSKDFVNVHVNDSSGNHLEGAIVTVLDVDGNQANTAVTGAPLTATATTLADGFIPNLFEVTELDFLAEGQSTVITYKTPHTITASKTNYATGSTIVNLTATNHTTVTITLEPLPTRNVSVSQPDSVAIYNTTIASYLVTITNQGQLADNYSVTVVNTDSATTATSNTSTILNLAQLQTQVINLTVSDPTPENYSVSLNITSLTDGSVSQTVSVSTNVTAAPPQLTISLVNPIADKTFQSNQVTEFTVLVSCLNDNCGEVNVSLDPEEGGGDPDCNANIATDCRLEDQACIDAPACGWIPGVSCGPNVGEGCNSLGDQETCEAGYQCIFNVVGGNVCNNCGWVDGSCGPNVGASCEIQAPAPPTKSGLVNTTPGAIPFWTSQQNPRTITLISGASQYVSWPITTTGTPASEHTFYAYVNTTTGTQINARTSDITVTIGNGSVAGLTGCWNYDGDSTSCAAAGCVYEPFTGICRFNMDNMGCNNFCDFCELQSSCETSSKNCTWESGGFCHENFANFAYGTGGSFDADAGWYTDKMPPNCAIDPTSCDSTFNTVFNFVEIESVCFDLIDNDQDGNVDCDDPDCYYRPACLASYDPATDTTAPQIKHYNINENDISATVSFTATKPVAGTVLFYGEDSTCSTLNKSLASFNDPSTTQDDYLVSHFVPLDQYSDSLGYSLTNGTSYYLKFSVVDRANLGYNSTCLNFNTSAAFKEFKMNFTGLQFDDAGDADFLQFDFGAGFVDYNSSAGLSANATKNVKMKFPNFYGMEFQGIDFAQSATFNFSGIQKNGGSCSYEGKACVGIDSTAWQQMVQQLGVDNVSIKAEATTCDNVFRCNDNGSICSEVTGNATCLDYNITHKELIIPAWLGFSTYVVVEDDVVASSSSSSGSSSSAAGSSGGGNSCAPGTKLVDGICVTIETTEDEIKEEKEQEAEVALDESVEPEEDSAVEEAFQKAGLKVFGEAAWEKIKHNSSKLSGIWAALLLLIIVATFFSRSRHSRLFRKHRKLLVNVLRVAYVLLFLAIIAFFVYIYFSNISTFLSNLF